MNESLAAEVCLFMICRFDSGVASTSNKTIVENINKTAPKFFLRGHCIGMPCTHFNRVTAWRHSPMLCWEITWDSPRCVSEQLSMTIQRSRHHSIACSHLPCTSSLQGRDDTNGDLTVGTILDRTRVLPFLPFKADNLLLTIYQSLQ